jgi:hypothetical protein
MQKEQSKKLLGWIRVWGGILGWGQQKKVLTSLTEQEVIKNIRKWEQHN